jgi:hypothetical protein
MRNFITTKLDGGQFPRESSRFLILGSQYGLNPALERSFGQIKFQRVSQSDSGKALKPLW